MEFPAPWFWALVAVVSFLIILVIYSLIFLDSVTSVTIDHSTVVITGGSQGIGLATAVRLSRMGANIILVSRNEGKLQQAQTQVQAVRKKDTQSITYIAGDVTNTDLAEALASRIREGGRHIREGGGTYVHRVGGYPMYTGFQKWATYIV